jgi:hypothetical protein
MMIGEHVEWRANKGNKQQSVTAREAKNIEQVYHRASKRTTKQASNRTANIWSEYYNKQAKQNQAAK